MLGCAREQKMSLPTERGLGAGEELRVCQKAG